MPPPRCRRASSSCGPSGTPSFEPELPPEGGSHELITATQRSCGFRLRRKIHHGDRPARTLIGAHTTADAAVQVETVPLPRTKLHYRPLGAGRVTAIALETVAARQAALRLDLRLDCVQASHHLRESGPAQLEIGARLPARGGDRAIPEVQHRRGDHFVWR